MYQTKIFYCDFCTYQTESLQEIRNHEEQLNHLFYCNEMVARGMKVRPGTCIEAFYTLN